MSQHAIQRRISFNKRRWKCLLCGCRCRRGWCCRCNKIRDGNGRSASTGSEDQVDQQQTIQGEQEAAFRHKPSKKEKYSKSLYTCCIPLIVTQLVRPSSFNIWLMAC